MDVVKQAFNFLKKKGGFRRVGASERVHEEIADFLSYPKRRVEQAYSNLRAAGEVEIIEKDSRAKNIVPVPKKVFAEMPSQKHAEEFRRAAQSFPFSIINSPGYGIRSALPS